MLKLIKTHVDEDLVIKHYEADFAVELAGDSIWSDTAGKVVQVTGITVLEEAYDYEVSRMVNVVHDAGWDIYTDTGFERAISEALGYAVVFTEQGMQEDGVASLEA